MDVKMEPSSKIFTEGGSQVARASSFEKERNNKKKNDRTRKNPLNNFMTRPFCTINDVRIV
jgi:hypothetical protein